MQWSLSQSYPDMGKVDSSDLCIRKWSKIFNAINVHSPLHAGIAWHNSYFPDAKIKAFVELIKRV